MRYSLNAIDKLPEQAIPLAQQAFDALVCRRATQLDILATLNRGLTELDIAPVSKSAFSRWAIHVVRGNAQRPTGNFG